MKSLLIILVLPEVVGVPSKHSSYCVQRISKVTSAVIERVYESLVLSWKGFTNVASSYMNGFPSTAANSIKKSLDKLSTPAVFGNPFILAALSYEKPFHDYNSGFR